MWLRKWHLDSPSDLFPSDEICFLQGAPHHNPSNIHASSTNTDTHANISTDTHPSMQAHTHTSMQTGTHTHKQNTGLSRFLFSDGITDIDADCYMVRNTCEFRWVPAYCIIYCYRPTYTTIYFRLFQ